MRIAINGFGRIGRNVFKAGFDKGINFVAINDLTDTKTLAYLLKYDSVYGVYDKKIIAKKDSLIINGKNIRVFAEKDPSKLPCKKLNIDIIIESTGFFTKKQDAFKHIEAGAKKVVISAPSDDADITIVLGVNHDKLKKQHFIISMGSCTTNCLAPIVKVLNDAYGIKNGFMTTAHAYTTDQNILDGPHKKLRRGRSAVLSIVPTTSGAKTATTLTIPELKDKVDGLALRVPVPCGSVVDFVANLKKKTTVNNVNKLFKKMSSTKLKNILVYTEDEIVSSDIIGNPSSSIIDGLSTMVIDNTFVKVLSWYDNEWGYSNRMVDLIKFMYKNKIV